MVVTLCWCIWFCSPNFCYLLGALVYVCIDGVHGKICGLKWM